MDGNTFYFGFEPWLIEWLQTHLGAAGTVLGTVFTALGEQVIMIALLVYLYWCYDKNLGKIIGTNIVVAGAWNPLLKNIFLRRRPYFDHENIKCLKAPEADADISDIEAQGFSFPSGHSTNSAAVYGTLPFFLKHKIFKVLAILLPFLVGLSRIILGVHYPTDVLVGWIMGAASAVGLTYIQKKVKRKWIIHIVLLAISSVGFFFCRTDDYFTAMGIMIGLFAAIPFEEKFVNFKSTRDPLESILRVGIGFGLYGLLNLLLKLPFSYEFLHSGTTAAHMVRLFRYLIIVFLLIGVYPMLFRFYPSKKEKKA